jgi:hypothetical protein
MVLITGTSLVTTSPLAAATTRFAIESAKLGHKEILYKTVLNKVFKYSIRVAFLAIPISAVLSLGSGDISLLIECLLYCLINAFFGVAIVRAALLAGLRMRGRQSCFYLVDIVIRPLLTYYILINTRADCVMALFASFASYVVVNLSQKVIFCGPLHYYQEQLGIIPQVDTQYSMHVDDWDARISSFTRPFKYWGSLSFVQSMSDIYFVGIYLGISATASMALLKQLVYSPIVMSSSILGTYLEPILYEKVDSSHNKPLAKSTLKMSIFSSLYLYYLFVASMIILPIASLGATSLLHVFSSSYYAHLAQYIPIVALAAIVFSACQFRFSYLIGSLGPESVSRPKIIYPVISIILSLILPFLFGIGGAVLALLLSAVILIIFLIFIQ